MQVIHEITAPWHSTLVARGGFVCLLVGVPAAAIGCWVLLRDLPYAAESLAHGMFPGLVAAALLGISPIIGGLFGLFLAAGLITLATRSGLGGDSAVAAAVTPLLGLGALLALAGSVPVGLDGILFGDVLGSDSSDLLLALGLSAFTLVSLRLGHWRLVGAGILSRAGKSTDILIIVLLSLATVAAARSLGALLAVALILGPAAAARKITNRAGPMILAACLIAAVAGIVGIEISWHADLAGGPTIALCSILPAAITALPVPYRRRHAT